MSIETLKALINAELLVAEIRIEDDAMNRQIILESLIRDIRRHLDAT